MVHRGGHEFKSRHSHLFLTLRDETQKQFCFSLSSFSRSLLSQYNLFFVFVCLRLSSFVINTSFYLTNGIIKVEFAIVLMRYLLLVLLIILLLLVACTPAQRQAQARLPQTPQATPDNILVVPEAIDMPVNKQATMHISYYNDHEESQKIGFKEELFDKDTLTCFDIYGLNRKVVLRLPEQTLLPNQATELALEVEDKSGANPGTEIMCTVQLTAELDGAYEKEFTIDLEPLNVGFD